MLSVALLVSACSLKLAPSGNDAGVDQDASCKLTLSGAVTGTYVCTSTAIYQLEPDGGQSAISITEPSQSIQIVLQHPGIFTSESWTSSDASAWSGTALVTAIGGHDWACISNSSTTSDLGSYDASVTVESAPTPTSTGFYTLKGSFTGTLVVTSGGDASPVTLTASF